MSKQEILTPQAQRCAEAGVEVGRDRAVHERRRPEGAKGRRAERPPLRSEICQEPAPCVAERVGPAQPGRRGLKCMTEAPNRLTKEQNRNNVPVLFLMTPEGNRDPRRCRRSRHAGVARPVSRHGGGVGPDHRDAVKLEPIGPQIGSTRDPWFETRPAGAPHHEDRSPKRRTSVDLTLRSGRRPRLEGRRRSLLRTSCCATLARTDRWTGAIKLVTAPPRRWTGRGRRACSWL
jgi:hypothetical protein